MSSRLFVTLRTRNSKEEVDIELPGSQPVSSFMEDILKVLNWPHTSGNRTLCYYLQTENGDRIPPDQTLNDIGIENFDLLWIFFDESNSSQPALEEKRSSRIPGQDDYLEDVEDSLPSPVSARLPIEHPCLVSDEGLIFMLGQSPMIIGRRSREATPQIDLTELDTGFISSRRHAEIVFTSGRYVLRGFNTRNGMLVNGARLTPGEPCALNDGDRLQFGFRGVQLVYRQP